MFDDSTIERRDTNRIRVLEELHKLVGDDTFRSARVDWVTNNANVSRDAAQAVVAYLVNEGLVRWHSLGHLAITHKGIKAIERLHRDPEQEAAKVPVGEVDPRQYQFHPEIEKVSGRLFRDRHYKAAALEAYIRVIAEVRERSQLLTLDGDRLMNRAFGSANQKPVIQFNDLATDADRDEQNGLMMLYKGVVGLRNTKAHSNRIFDDPNRGFEYLALASLLMRLLEVAQVNSQRPKVP